MHTMDLNGYEAVNVDNLKEEFENFTGGGSIHAYLPGEVKAPPIVQNSKLLNTYARRQHQGKA